MITITVEPDDDGQGGEAAWEPAPGDRISRWVRRDLPAASIVESMPWCERLMLLGWDHVRQLEREGWAFVNGECEIGVPDWSVPLAVPEWAEAA